MRLPARDSPAYRTRPAMKHPEPAPDFDPPRLCRDAPCAAAFAAEHFAGRRIGSAGAGIAAVVGRAGRRRNGQRDERRIWPGQAVHLLVHVGRTEPARHVRHEARRAARGARAVSAGVDARAGRADLRTLRTAGRIDRQTGDRAHAGAYRSGAPFQRTYHADRPPGAKGEQRCRSAERARYAAHRLDAGEVAQRVGHAAAVRDASLAGLPSVGARRKGSGATWRLVGALRTIRC